MVTVPPAIDRPPPSCKTEGYVRELSSNGVMDESLGNVEKASAHAAVFLHDMTIERRDRKGQLNFIQRGDGGRFREDSEGERSPAAHTRTNRTGQGKVIQRGDG